MATSTINETVFKNIAKDISGMKTGIAKLVSIQTVNSRDRARNFFDRESQKESLLESRFGKATQSSPTKSGRGEKGGGLGFGTGTSVIDFIKNIANMLIKGALVALGTFGLAKLLQNDDIRKTIKEFISKMFFSVLEVIEKGARILTEIFKENGPQIREAIVSTFVAIKDLLITGIKNTAELLSDKRIWEGLWEIIQAIYEGIKKVLSTKINVAGEEVSLGLIVGAVITAFGVLKASVWLLKMAADKAAASLFGVGNKKGLDDVPDAPDKSGSQREKGSPGKGSMAKSMLPWLKGGSAILAATISGNEFQENTEDAEMAKKREQLLKDNPTPTKPAPAKPDTTKPLTPTQIGGVQSEAKKFLGKNTADYLAAKEGFSAVAYLDPPGNKKNQYSIGHGHLIQSQEIAQGYILLADGKKLPVNGVGGKDTKITKEQAKLLLQSDLPKYEKLAADPLGPEAWAKLSDDQKTALISYAYNTGSTVSLVKAGLKDAILKGDMEKAAEIISSKGIKTAEGKFHAGLEARRMSESTLFAGGKFPNPSGTESPTMLAKNETKAPVSDSKKPESESMLGSLLDSMTEQLAALDQMMGGKLGIDSIALQTAFRQMDKEFMNNPTFVDSSTNVSNASGPAPGTAVSASVWDSQMTSLFVDRVA